MPQSLFISVESLGPGGFSSTINVSASVDGAGQFLAVVQDAMRRASLLHEGETVRLVSKYTADAIDPPPFPPVGPGMPS